MPASIKHLMDKKLNLTSLLARWKDGLYYTAAIVKCDKINKKCLVCFEDGSEVWVNNRDVHIQLSLEQLNEDEDIVCCICDDGCSEPPNEIILCDVCQQGYHQKCHNPPVDSSKIDESEDTSDHKDWFCATCSYILNQSNRAKLSATAQQQQTSQEQQQQPQQSQPKQHGPPQLQLKLKSQPPPQPKSQQPKIQQSPQPKTQQSPQPKTQQSPQPKTQQSPQPKTQQPPSPKSQQSSQPKSQLQPPPKIQTHKTQQSPQPKPQQSPQPKSQPPPQPSSPSQPQQVLPQPKTKQPTKIKPQSEASQAQPQQKTMIGPVKATTHHVEKPAPYYPLSNQTRVVATSSTAALASMTASSALVVGSSAGRTKPDLVNQGHRNPHRQSQPQTQPRSPASNVEVISAPVNKHAVRKSSVNFVMPVRQSALPTATRSVLPSTPPSPPQQPSPPSSTTTIITLAPATMPTKVTNPIATTGATPSQPATATKSPISKNNNNNSTEVAKDKQPPKTLQGPPNKKPATWTMSKQSPVVVLPTPVNKSSEVQKDLPSVTPANVIVNNNYKPTPMPNMADGSLGINSSASSSGIVVPAVAVQPTVIVSADSKFVRN